MSAPVATRRRLRLPRGRWGRIGALAGVVVVLLGVVVLARGGSTSVAIRTQVQTITVPGGPGVTGTVDLDTTLYLPPTLPAPAVIMAHGFGGSKDSVADDAHDLATHGFVVLAYSARGFGRSTGQIGLDSLNYEVPDARALVDWLSHRSEVTQDKPGDPRVGVEGGSYGGALALMLAATDPRVDAVAALITWNDLSTALFPNGVDATDRASGVFKKAWTSNLVASISTGASVEANGTAQADSGDSGFGRSSTDASASADPSTGAGSAGSAGLSASGCGRLMAALCVAYAQAAETGQLSTAFRSLLSESSPATVADKIKAPTLLVQGQQDTLFGLDQSDANAKAISANGTPVAVTWYNGGHDGATTPDQVTKNRVLGWFSHYLSGTGPTPSTAFVYSVNGPLADTGRARTRTLQAPDYPGLTGTSAVQRSSVALSGSAQSVLNPPGGIPAGISSLPGLSGLSGLAGSALSAFAGGLPGQTARFSSQPLAQLTVFAGTPQVTLSVSGPAAQGTAGGSGGAVLFTSVSKVSATGVRSLAGNAVSPIRLADLPTDGRPVTVTVNLPTVALQVEAGSHVEVTVSTTDQAYSGSISAAQYRVALGSAAAVTLPQVGGVRISAGEVPVGVLVALIVLVALLIVALILGGRVRRRPSRSGPTEDAPPLVIAGLAKAYPGGVTAVSDVSFRLDRGQVLGLLGPNGAGKTTTLRMVMGLITPTAGTIEVFGQPVLPGSPILSRIGSFVEGAGFLPHLSGRANLELYWRATGRPAVDAHMDDALAIAGLGTAVRRKVRTYSQGMRQRLAIAQAMLGLPDLLLLDEPTNGLDPPQIHAMREVLRRYAASGRTVLVSSHLLAEVEQTCSHVVVVHLGRTIASGTVAEMVSAGGDLVFAVDDVPRAVEVLSALPGATDVRNGDMAGTVRADLSAGSAAAGVAALVQAGVAVSSAAPRHRLEDVFLDLVGAAGPTGGGSA